MLMGEYAMDRIRTKQLASIADIQVGYQARSGIQNESDGTYRLIQGKDFDSSHNLKIDNIKRFNPERIPQIYSVIKGDILFQARGLEHFAYCLTDSLENTVAAGTFYIIRVKNNNVLPRYLAWWINQVPARSYLQSQAGETSISYVSKFTISKLTVKIPPIEVQANIVKVMALWQCEKELHDQYENLKDRMINKICLKSFEE